MLSKKNSLICEGNSPDHVLAMNSFCGQMFRNVADFNAASAEQANAVVYVCGDVDALCAQLDAKLTVLAVRELCNNFQERGGDRYRVVSLGQLPVNVHNLGVMFPKLFDDPTDLYDAITKEHVLQGLKLSNKPTEAFRKGIYLTPVVEYGDETHFHVLRCSTNLDGPTENFRATDKRIVGAVNEVRERFFEGSAELNHVLAQTYHNHRSEDGREKKAKISSHSDKTKDMPEGGLIAFCTFYQGYSGDSFSESEGHRRAVNEAASLHSFDYAFGKHDVTVLTKLRFRLKPEAEALHPDLVKQFDVTFFPNSVFIISLTTNRLYTHETVPSLLPVDKIPVRMGYVIRCSNTRAIHRDGQTFLVKSDNSVVPLHPPDGKGLKELSDSYYLENTTIQKIDYRDRFFFSMNSGDYLKPVP